jgi:PAS domain S-box-containing protein
MSSTVADVRDPKLRRPSVWQYLRRAAGDALARPRGLRSHLIILVLVAITPSLVLHTLGGYHELNTFRHIEAHHLVLATASLSREVDAEVGELVKATQSLADSTENGADVPMLEKATDAVSGALGASITIWRVIGDTAVELTGRNSGALADRDTIAEVRLAAVTSSPLVSGRAASATIQIAVPVAADRSIVLRAAFGSARISAILASLERNKKAAVVIVDPLGGVVARSPKASEADVNAASAEVRRLAGHGTELVSRRPGSSSLIVRSPLLSSKSLQLVVVEPEGVLGAFARGPLVLLIATTFVSILVAVTAAFVIGSYLLMPLRRLTDAAQAVAGGAESLGPPPNSSVIEFRGLHASLLRAERVMRRRAAAERLALQEARTGHELLSSVVNGTADQIYVKDLDLRYVLANKATLLLPFLNRDEWQVLGRRVMEINTSEDARIGEQLDREVLATGDVRRARFTWRRSDGKLGTFALTKSPWRDASGRIAGVVTVVHDITEHREAERRLAAVQGELLRATRLSAMGAMASGLAHELNQPLSAATNFLNAAIRLLARDPAKSELLELARGAIADAVLQTLRAGGIVRRLREFVGRGEADLKVDDVGGIIDELCEVVRADGATRTSTLAVDVIERPLLVLADRTQLQQVLLNLIRNAAEAIGDVANGRIDVCARMAPGDKIEIVVCDNGPGLPPEIVDRLFQPFASTKAFGMGIGLAICRTIVEGHGGTLTAGASRSGGARFQILLPATSQLGDFTNERASE